MIDTFEKLVAVVDAHQVQIVARAMDMYVEERDDDVWGTYFFDGGEIDFNIYRQEDDPAITIWAYALKRTDDNPPWTKVVNTEIGVFVACIDFEEAEQ